MPLYEYECKQCHQRLEKIQSFSAPPEKVCPKCGGELERVISAPAIQFKGAGWYVNDYAKSGGRSVSDNKGEAKPESGNESKSENKDGGSKDSGGSTKAAAADSSSSSSGTPASNSSAAPASSSIPSSSKSE